MTVRTRFAPSPTGFLHIGGVRTALFNWLFARHHGGQFVLRIDDTDQTRNVAEALEPILAGFRWLGIDWDEGPCSSNSAGGDSKGDGPFGPYYQSQRLDRYQAAAKELISKDLAYYDYATTEEVQAEREAAKAAKGSFVYSRRWMAETDEDRARFEGEGRTGVVRLKMHREGNCEIPDLIRGNVSFRWADEQDHVIQRADGTCLYHLASVVDDHDMQISHVIRAEEHLSNTPRQIFIAAGLGFDLPEYAHVPFVAEPGSKNKLSKRKLEKYLKNREFAKINQHGQAVAERLGLEISADTFNPVIVDFYEQVGFLPDAIINYLLLLGWSLDDKTELLTRQEMIEHFSLERVNNSAASFDPAKLMAFEDHWMQQLPAKQKVAMMLPYLQTAGLVASPPPCDVAEKGAEKLDQIITAAGDRIKVAGDILDYADFFLADDQVEYDEKPFNKRLLKPTAAAALLSKFRDCLADADTFTVESLDELLHHFVEREEIKIGQIVHALRVAVTGKGVGFGVFETLAILGRESCLARIDRALDRVKSLRV